MGFVKLLRCVFDLCNAVRNKNSRYLAVAFQHKGQGIGFTRGAPAPAAEFPACGRSCRDYHLRSGGIAVNARRRVKRALAFDFQGQVIINDFFKHRRDRLTSVQGHRGCSGFGICRSPRPLFELPAGCRNGGYFDRAAPEMDMSTRSGRDAALAADSEFELVAG